MQHRPLLIGLAAVALACTSASKDDTVTEPASSGAGSTGSMGSTGSTGHENPTSGSSTGETGAGSSSGTPGTTETGSSAAETGSMGVSFTDVYEQVLLPGGCLAGYCHGGGAGGLEMTDEATAYANLVEVNATTAVCDQSMRVVPGSIETSILWSRVRPAALDPVPPCATKMPMGSMGLGDVEAQLVSDWISGGALE